MAEYGNNVGNYTYFNPYIRSCLKSIFIFCGIKKEREEDVDCNLISKRGSKASNRLAAAYVEIIFCSAAHFVDYKLQVRLGFLERNSVIYQNRY